MKFRWTHAILATLGATTLWVLSVTLAEGQATQRPQMAEDVFKNIQLLKDIPVDEFMDVMGFLLPQGQLIVAFRLSKVVDGWISNEQSPLTNLNNPFALSNIKRISEFPFGFRN